MKFITAIYGNIYLPFLWTLLQSIFNHHPNDSVSIFYGDISNHEIKILRTTFPNYEFIQNEISIIEMDPNKKIPLKLRYWSKACNMYPGEFLCVLDCDTVLCANISSFKERDYDILYTWKNERYPLNTGVMFLDNKKNTRVFMEYWLKQTEKIIADPILFQNALDGIYGTPDQHAFSEILNTKNYDNLLNIKIDGCNIKFKGIECKYLNETNCTPITEKTHIIHYKGGWHRILLKNKQFSKNRPQKSCLEMFCYWQKIYHQNNRNSMKKYCTTSALNYKEKFSLTLNGYEERGILHSEMLLICSIIQNLNIDLVIESGRCKGQSTEILAKNFSESKIKIISIEINKNEYAEYVENKLKNYSNLKLLYGDSNLLIPEIINKYPEKKIAILFDGPKGERAINIFKRIINDYQNVIIGFFHDMRKSTINMPSPGRFILENSFDRVFFTDDNEYIDLFRDLDQSCLPKDKEISNDDWRPWMKGNVKIGSYGPTLGVIFPVQGERIINVNSKIKKNIILRIITYAKYKIESILKIK